MAGTSNCLVYNFFNTFNPVNLIVCTKTVISLSEDFHYNFSPLECTQEPWISSQPVIFICSFFHTLVLPFNPLMPVPPVTASDEPWPFFLFWRHHFWPKLASSLLNVCRRKRSFQWCPDQSDRPNGPLNMHKSAKKVEWKAQSKISCYYTWLLHAKIAHLDDAPSEVF